MKKRTEITFEGIQIKSLEKAKKFCTALNVIEEECGIHEVRITLKDIFFCPWIDIEKLCSTPMEELVRDIIKKMK